MEGDLGWGGAGRGALRAQRLSQVRSEGRPAWRGCGEQGPGRDCTRREKEAQVTSGKEGGLCQEFGEAIGE